MSQPSRLHRVDLRGSFGWPTSSEMGDTNAGWSHDQAALAGRSASINAFEGRTPVIGKGSQVHPSAEVLESVPDPRAAPARTNNALASVGVVMLI